MKVVEIDCARKRKKLIKLKETNISQLTQEITDAIKK